MVFKFLIVTKSKCLVSGVTPQTMEMHLTKLNGIISHKLSILKPAIAKLSLEERREIIYSKVSSIILYGASLYCGQTDQIKAKFTNILMKCNIAIYK